MRTRLKRAIPRYDERQEPEHAGHVGIDDDAMACTAGKLQPEDVWCRPERRILEPLRLERLGLHLHRRLAETDTRLGESRLPQLGETLARVEPSRNSGRMFDSVATARISLSTQQIARAIPFARRCLPINAGWRAPAT